jgi:hypothetical protein
MLRCVPEKYGFEESLWEVDVPAWTRCFIFTLMTFQLVPYVPRRGNVDLPFRVVSPRVESCVLPSSHAVCPASVHHGVTV